MFASAQMVIPVERQCSNSSRGARSSGSRTHPSAHGHDDSKGGILDFGANLACGGSRGVRREIGLGFGRRRMKALLRAARPRAECAIVVPTFITGEW